MGLVWPRSVDLKLDRASLHIEELKTMLGDYAESRPYEAVRDYETYPDPYRRTYRAVLSDEPPEMLPVVVGDIVHNLRSALDHLAVALAQSRSAAFPIFDLDPWELDERTGGLIEKRQRSRDSWDWMTDGMAEEVKAQVKRMQPYTHTPITDSPLYTLGRLSNADKHRWLVTIGTGIVNPNVVVQSRRDGIRWTAGPQPGKFVNGAIVHRLRIAPGDVESGECTQQMFDSIGDPNTEVDVHIEGTPLLGLQLGSDKRVMYDLPKALDHLHWWVGGLAVAFRQSEFD